MSKFVKNPNYAEHLRPSPGPAKYKMPSLMGCIDHDLTKPRLPCYTMGSRSGIPSSNDGPGPGKYNVEKLNRFGTSRVPGYMGEKLPIDESNDTPAPNAYEVPKLMGGDRAKNFMQRSPEFSMGQRLTVGNDSGSPGPAKYAPNAEAGGKRRAPSYSMAARLPDGYQDGSPGPATYLPKDVDHRLPPSFKSRHSISLDNGVPGPKYNLGSYLPGRQMPGYTMGIRYPDWLEPVITEADV